MTEKIKINKRICEVLYLDDYWLPKPIRNSKTRILLLNGAVLTAHGAVSLKTITQAPETIEGSSAYVNTNRGFTSDQILKEE